MDVDTEPRKPFSFEKKRSDGHVSDQITRLKI